jgi:hypothetical protein
LQVAEGKHYYNISLTKKSSNVSGFTTFNGEKVANITNIRFIPDRSVENNTAIYAVTVESDETGFYTKELSPGSYDVTIDHEFTENGQNYSYKFTGKLVIGDEPSIISYDIPMTREARE